MGTVWRRAFCRTIPRDKETKLIDDDRHHQQQSCQSQGPSPSPSPRSYGKLGFSSTASNPSTPKLHSQPLDSPSLRCKTIPSSNDGPISPRLHRKTTINTPKYSNKSSKTNPSSPRSPFSILKNSLRLSRSSCGVCMQSVKTSQRMAIYTAECSHTFHFPCIASHVRKQGMLVCPVCNSSWKDVPLLAIYKLQHQQQQQQQQGQEEQAKEIIVEDNAKKFDEMNPQQHHHPRTLSNVNITKQQENWKTYEDDEPLVSKEIIDIPEANEGDVDEEEEEEFKSFFVNPILSDDGLAHHLNSNRSVEVSLMPETALVSSVGRNGIHENTYAVVLKVKAPAAAHNNNTAHILEPGRRAPIDLVTVLDVGGSMSRAKLQMLKRAMCLVISSLGSADRLSILAFSAKPKRLMSFRRMTAQGQRAARRIIDRLAYSQGTSVGEALRQATKVLEDRRERNPVASIMLLSDGQDEGVQANCSDRPQGSSHVSSTRFGHIEIPVHSSVFGEKHSYTHEPVEDAFSKCVGGLLSVVVQDLRIQLSFAPGSDPAEISAVYLCNQPKLLSSGSTPLGDFYAEEEREVLLELRVPAKGIHHILSVKYCYKDPATQKMIYDGEQTLLIPGLQAVRSSSPRIERMRNLFITTRAIAESRQLIEHNELTSAMHLLTSARALLLQSSQASAEEYIKGLEAELDEVQWRRHYQQQTEEQKMIQRQRLREREKGLFLDENGEPLTPTSPWRAADKLAKVAQMKKSINRVSDLHGF